MKQIVKKGALSMTFYQRQWMRNTTETSLSQHQIIDTCQSFKRCDNNNLVKTPRRHQNKYTNKRS